MAMAYLGTAPPMQDDIRTLRDEFLARVAAATELRALDEARVSSLGRKGAVTGLMKRLGTLAPERRRDAGVALNRLKDDIREAIDARARELEREDLERALDAERVDVTLPPRPRAEGGVHPVSQVTEEIVAVFCELGFAVAEGPRYRGRVVQFRGA